MKRRLFLWLQRASRSLFLWTLHKEGAASMRTMEAGCAHSHVALDLMSCPRCYGHALSIEELGEVPIVRCQECGLFMGTFGTRSLVPTAEVWNMVGAYRTEHVRLAETLRQCPRLYREMISR